MKPEFLPLIEALKELKNKEELSEKAIMDSLTTYIVKEANLPK